MKSEAWACVFREKQVCPPCACEELMRIIRLLGGLVVGSLMGCGDPEEPPMSVNCRETKISTISDTVLPLVQPVLHAVASRDRARLDDLSASPAVVESTLGASASERQSFRRALHPLRRCSSLRDDVAVVHLFYRGPSTGGIRYGPRYDHLSLEFRRMPIGWKYYRRMLWSRF